MTCLSAERAAMFWTNVHPEPNTGCFLWSGALFKSGGYGAFKLGSRGTPVMRAHRLAWELVHGPIPAGLVLRHSCDNPCCVNPDHLALGTRADNQRDMARRCRGSRGSLPYGVRRVRGRFHAQASYRGTSHHLGAFATPEEAHAAAMQAKRRFIEEDMARGVA